METATVLEAVHVRCTASHPPRGLDQEGVGYIPLNRTLQVPVTCLLQPSILCSPALKSVTSQTSDHTGLVPVDIDLFLGAPPPSAPVSLAARAPAPQHSPAVGAVGAVGA
ncbi:unnamed protein product [Pleuronectes platessa]|uniref:Uncharacterized protein n=1 Tax=Pleuronectes platessa TaxID=8262 RepID=A0A9N7UZ37_PLEPL|nr:unnamed protein product [Pleuronectes platessa]